MFNKCTGILVKVFRGNNGMMECYVLLWQFLFIRFGYKMAILYAGGMNAYSGSDGMKFTDVRSEKLIMNVERFGILSNS